MTIFRTLAIALFAAASSAQAAQSDPDLRFGNSGYASYDLSFEEPFTDTLLAMTPAPGGGYLAIISRQVSLNTASLAQVQMTDRGEIVRESLIADSFYAQFSNATFAPDGAALIVSPMYIPALDHFGQEVRRVLPGGNVDTGFGSNGRAVLQDALGALSNGVLGVDAQGNISVAAYYLPNGSNPGPAYDTFVAQLLPDGQPRTAFGGDGTVVVAMVPGENENPRAVLRDASGNVFVCGDGSFGNDNHLTLTKLLPSGVPDSSYGSGGTAVYDSGPMTDGVLDSCLDMGIHPTTNRINVAAERYGGGDGQGSLRVFAMGTTGVFGGGDPVFHVMDALTSAKMAFEPSGKILLASRVKNVAGAVDLAIVRLTAARTIDPTFVETRYPMVFPLGGTRRDVDRVTALFPDRGRIVAAGTYALGGADTMWSVLRVQGTSLFSDGLED